MEPSSQLLGLFGLTLEGLIAITGMVFYLVEAAKGKWPGVFLGGARTDFLGLALSFVLSWKMYYPSWEPIIAATFLCWLLPIGIYKRLQNGGTG